MIVKTASLSLSFIITMVLSKTFENELQSDCSLKVNFDYDKDGHNLANVSCFRTCFNDSPKVEQPLNRHSLYYQDNDVQKKYNRMVEITVSQDGTMKCVLDPTNTSVQNTIEEAYLIPEKLVSQSPTNCPMHYEYVKKIKTCLRFSDDEVTWNEASSACVADGGTLAIINSEEKQNAFNSAAGSTLIPRISTPIDKYGLIIWIGLSDIKKEGKFEWVDGSPLNYSRWFPNEPNDANSNEDCVHIAFLNNISLWNDRPCEGKARYVCESKTIQIIERNSTIPYFSTTVTPSTTILPFSNSSGTLVVHICPSGWWKSNASETCYYIGEDGRNVNQSAYYCQSVGGTLASIPNSLEMQYIQGLLERNDITSIWIGLTDWSLEGRFEWVDGTPFTYSSWGDNQPDDWKASEDCVAIDRTWKYLWIDMSCEIKVKQLCKRSSEKLAIKPCSSGNLVIRKVDENFLLDDLTCPTLGTPSLLCLQGDGSDETISDNQYLTPLAVVSALLGLHFFGFILVSFCFCKFYRKHRGHGGCTKSAKEFAGSPKMGNMNMTHNNSPKVMKVPPVPAPLAGRNRDQDGNYEEEYHIYDGPEYDTDKYGYYINPRVK